jgi:hypothetical protein
LLLLLLLLLLCALCAFSLLRNAERRLPPDFRTGRLGGTVTPGFEVLM